MNPADTLAGLYGQWRALTEAEGESIRRQGWDDVRRHQEAKAQLQRQIVQAAQCLSPEFHEHHFRPVLEDLALSERRNAGLLAGQIESRRGAMRDLDKSSRRLRQLHRSYVNAPDEHWHSYS